MVSQILRNWRGWYCWTSSGEVAGTGAGGDGLESLGMDVGEVLEARWMGPKGLMEWGEVLEGRW